MDQNVAENYGWHAPEAPHAHAYLQPAILKILKGLKVTRILDLGSGNGALCRYLAAAGFDVVGAEVDGRGVEISKSSSSHIPFYELGVQHDPSLLLKTEIKFDAVVSTEVVEHLFSPHLLPQFARQVLREGGYLVVSTPYHGYLKNLAISLLGKWDFHHSPLWHGGHIKFWSRPSLTRLLEENGFDVIDFAGIGRLPYLWKSMIIVAKASPDR